MINIQDHDANDDTIIYHSADQGFEPWRYFLFKLLLLESYFYGSSNYSCLASGYNTCQATWPPHLTPTCPALTETWNLQNTCPALARPVKLARHLPGTYPALARYLPGTCPALARHLPGTCPALARHLPGTCPVLARHLPGTCPALTRHLPGHS